MLAREQKDKANYWSEADSEQHTIPRENEKKPKQKTRTKVNPKTTTKKENKKYHHPPNTRRQKNAGLRKASVLCLQ